jgi:hypothetical protein
VIDRALLGAEVGAWSALPPGVPPLILLTVAGSDGEAERVGRERASAVLVPPFQLRTLWSAVRAIETEKECV